MVADDLIANNKLKLQYNDDRDLTTWSEKVNKY